MIVIEVCVDCRVGSTLVGGISVLCNKSVLSFHKTPGPIGAVPTLICGISCLSSARALQLQIAGPHLSLCLSRSSLKKPIAQRICGQNMTVEGGISGFLEEYSVQLGMIKCLKH